MITTDELMAELQRLNSEEIEGFTSQEMSDALGHHVGWCRKNIGKLIKNGLAECVGKKQVESIDGLSRYAPVYRLKNSGKVV